MAARTLCLSAALAALALLPAAARPMDLDGAHPYGSGFVRAGEELVCAATNAPAKRTPSAGASWYVALNQ